jgi:hypothetical protein
VFRKRKPPGPDFSAIDSPAKADAMFRRGELEKLYLLPPEFGGADIPNNIVYVPLGFADVKQGIDLNIIAGLVAAGKVTSYAATPEYEGDSFIPIAITIVASDPGSFTSTINIWGEALARS